MRLIGQLIAMSVTFALVYPIAWVALTWARVASGLG